MTDTKVSKVSVALSPVERKIVERVDKKHGLNNFSAALRMIVREWDRSQAHWVGDAPKNGKKPAEVKPAGEVKE